MYNKFIKKNQRIQLIRNFFLMGKFLSVIWNAIKKNIQNS